MNISFKTIQNAALTISIHVPLCRVNQKLINADIWNIFLFSIDIPGQFDDGSMEVNQVSAKNKPCTGLLWSC